VSSSSLSETTAAATTNPAGGLNPPEWPPAAQETARQLHGQLSITDRQWHALKGQPQRRAAEQLAAALVLLLDPANPPAAAMAGPQRLQAADLVEHALGWLKGDLRDPGCPSHGR
jgi:hypothetical protein